MNLKTIEMPQHLESGGEEMTEIRLTKESSFNEERGEIILTYLTHIKEERDAAERWLLNNSIKHAIFGKSSLDGTIFATDDGPTYRMWVVFYNRDDALNFKMVWG